MTKNAVLSKAVETVEKPFESVGKGVVKHVQDAGRSFIEQLYGTTTMSDEEIKQREEQERMERDRTYGERLRELKQLTGSAPEKTQEELSSLQSSFKRFEQEAFAKAQALGTISPTTQEQERTRKEKLEKQEEERKKAKEKAGLETKVETPPGKVTAISFERKRPRVRMQRPPKSAETRTNRE